MFVRMLVCLAFILSPLSALAQASWGLTNISNQTLKFETFDPARGSWKEQTIYPNQPVNYTMSGGEGKFRIATQNRGFVEYRVLAGRRYTLGWDTGKGVWDLKFAQGSSAGPATAAPVVKAAAPYKLHNQSNQTLSFETLDPARGTWKSQSAYPNETKALTFAPGVKDGKIRVATPGRGYVEYDVHSGWKYTLLWNAAKGVWDLQTAERGL